MFQLEQVGAVPKIGEVLKHKDHAQDQVHFHSNIHEKKQVSFKEMAMQYLI